MPFITEGDEAAGPWKALDELRLRQLAPNSGKTYFAFDQRFGYTSVVPDPSRHGEYPGPEWERGEDATPDRPDAPWRPWQTDLASVPAFLWGVFPSYGRHTASALMHDTQCEEASSHRELGRPGLANRLRRRADLLFRVTLADVAEMGLARRWAMWTAVRLFSTWAIGALTAVVAVFLPLFALTPRALACAWLPMSVRQGVGLVLAVGVALLAERLIRVSYEEGADRGPAVDGPDTPAQPYPGGGATGFTWRAMASMVGAVLLGIPLVYLMVPVAAVTLVTRLVLAVGDILGEAACWVARFGRPRRRFTVFSPPPGPLGSSTPGPATGDDGEPGQNETATMARLQHLHFVGRRRSLPNMQFATWTDVGSEWALGVLIRREAPDEEIEGFKQILLHVYTEWQTPPRE